MRKVPLFLLFILVVTPLGLVLRVFRDPMSRRVERRRPSYWSD